MKKKLFALLCAIIACAGMLFAFTACDNVSSGGSGGALKMDKKYIGASYIHNDADKQVYYVFHANGTGEYHSYTHGGTLFTVHFKYSYADADKSAVVCFYDSVKPEGYGVSSTWDSFLTVSQNVLITTNITYYICEDYLPQIPNYRA